MRKLQHNEKHAIKPNDKQKIQKARFTYINDNRPCKKRAHESIFSRHNCRIWNVLQYIWFNLQSFETVKLFWNKIHIILCKKVIWKINNVYELANFCNYSMTDYDWLRSNCITWYVTLICHLNYLLENTYG